MMVMMIIIMMVVIIPENLVAICLERSIEMIVSIFGILNSEVGYVPINPQYSIEIQQYIFSPSCYLNFFHLVL